MNGAHALLRAFLARSLRQTQCPVLRRRYTAHYKKISSTSADDTFLTVSWCKSRPKPEMMELPKNCGTLVRSFVAWLEYTDTHTSVRKVLYYVDFGILQILWSQKCYEFRANKVIFTSWKLEILDDTACRIVIWICPFEMCWKYYNI